MRAGSLFKKVFSEFFTYSKKDRNGIILLILLIIILILTNIIINNIDFREKSDFTEIKKYISKLDSLGVNTKTEELNLFRFNPNLITYEELEKLSLPEPVKRNLLKYRNTGAIFKNRDDVKRIYGMTDSLFSLIEPYLILNESISEYKKELTPPEAKINTVRYYFDPNQVTYDELMKLGFNSRQAQNLISYRGKGGKFKTKQDLLKIYGIDDNLYRSLEDYIVIHSEIKTLPPEREVKIARIEINICQKEDLEKIPEIGEQLAKRIISYRNLLGGYYSLNQLREVYNIKNDIVENASQYFTIDTFQIQKIRLNFYDSKNLPKHPYIKQENWRRILEYRGINGAFKNADLLLKQGLVDSATYIKIAPYITCR
jgi:DNA uptake protein ComE-like DNA-binding protein